MMLSKQAHSCRGSTRARNAVPGAAKHNLSQSSTVSRRGAPLPSSSSWSRQLLAVRSMQAGGMQYPQQRPPSQQAARGGPSYMPAPQQQQQQMQMQPQQQVFLELSQVMGKQVITRTSGRSLGTISGCWMDPSRATLVSFDLQESKSSLLSTPQRAGNIPLASLRQIGDVVLVHDESGLYEQDLDGRMGFVDPLGLEVRTRAGEFLGKVRDLSFSPDTGAVARFTYDEFGLPTLPLSFFDCYSVAVEDVLSIGRGEVLVYDDAKYRERKESNGLFAAIPSLLKSLGTNRSGASTPLALPAAGMSEAYRSGAGGAAAAGGYLPADYSYEQWQQDLRRWEAETGMTYEQYLRNQSSRGGAATARAALPARAGGQYGPPAGTSYNPAAAAAAAAGPSGRGPAPGAGAPGGAYAGGMAQGAPRPMQPQQQQQQWGQAAGPGPGSTGAAAAGGDGWGAYGAAARQQQQQSMYRQQPQQQQAGQGVGGYGYPASQQQQQQPAGQQPLYQQRPLQPQAPQQQQQPMGGVRQQQPSQYAAAGASMPGRQQQPPPQQQQQMAYAAGGMAGAAAAAATGAGGISSSGRLPANGADAGSWQPTAAAAGAAGRPAAASPVPQPPQQQQQQQQGAVPQQQQPDAGGPPSGSGRSLDDWIVREAAGSSRMPEAAGAAAGSVGASQGPAGGGDVLSSSEEGLAPLPPFQSATAAGNGSA